MPKWIKNRLTMTLLLTLFVFLLSFPGIGMALPTTAASPNSWNAQTQYKARPMQTSAAVTYSPSQIITAYNLNSQSGGAGNTIAIIDAYNDPNIASDLSTFSSTYGLPQASLTVHEMSRFTSTNSGWAVETSLDVEWAHAIAPHANILLVEARSSSLGDLLNAVNYATSQKGVVAVSMSWGGSEFSTETAYDSYFANTGITFFASAGDNGAGVIWPAASPNVVSVGGTTLTLSPDGTVASETAWSGSGGGTSAYETMPTYQTNYGLTYGARSVPDVSYVADPSTGVAVYDSLPNSGYAGWYTVGGTSVGAPQWAAIQADGLTANNNNLYQVAQTTNDLYDITSGSNGNPAGPGYDQVTGLGSPRTIDFAPPTTPDFTLASNPSTLTIPAGTTGTSTISATALDGFASTIALTANDPNSFAQLSQTSIIPTQTATLSIPVPAGTPAGTYTVTITGTSGTLSHSTTVTYTVPTPGITLSSQPSSLTIQAGSTATTTLTAASTNGYSGTVTLTATAPNGWNTPTLNPSSLTINSETSGTSTLTITVPSTATPGQYTITVTATDSTGTPSQTTSITVNVASPDFTITASPSSISVKSGQTASSTLTIAALNGFQGTVSLQATAQRQGVTTTLSPSQISGSGTSTLTISVPSSIRGGSITVTITGTSGTLSHSTTVTVSVSKH